MNKTVSNFMREEILKGLLLLPKGHQDLFRRLYRNELTEDATTKKIVDQIPDEKLDWALCQVEYSHTKIKRKLAEAESSSP